MKFYLYMNGFKRSIAATQLFWKYQYNTMDADTIPGGATRSSETILI